LRYLFRALLGVFLLGVLWLVISPTGHYLLKAAKAEAGILARRRSITEMIADRSTPPAIAAKLRVVLAARAFAVDSVKLVARQSFTTYSHLDRDTLVLVLSGAYRDRLEPYTWWFPIVGRVPYKGFFDFALARESEQQLAAKGFDVYLRPSPAFSTLGWFNDPVLSTSLRADSIDIANTVIHELTHNTFYASGQAVFNESFANFVGARGSAWFFRMRGDSASADEADARWSDDKLMARFWDGLYREMDSAFKAHPGEDNQRARLTARDSIYARARTELVQVLGPQLRTIGPYALEHTRLDNAALLAHRIYLTDVDLFDQVWDREHGSLPQAVSRIIALARSKPHDPFGALRAWLRQPAP